MKMCMKRIEKKSKKKKIDKDQIRNPTNWLMQGWQTPASGDVQGSIGGDGAHTFGLSLKGW